MRVTVSIPDDLFEAAEALAERQRLSRSELYARALSRILDRPSAEDLTAQLDAVYAQEDTSIDPVLAQAQWRSISDKW